MSTKSISIAGIAFDVTAPYLAGHVLNEAEAKVLNQTRAENIGNNFRTDVKKASESGDAAAMETVRQALAKYDGEYQFSMTTARTPIDPIEAEAQKIAKEVLKVRIQEKYGIPVKKYLEDPTNAAKYEANLDRLSTQDDTLKLAKQRVAQKKKVLEVDSSGLDLA